MKMNARLIAAVLCAAACAPARGQAPAKIRLGHDTTRITGPLKPDGTPDYHAALNRQYGQGATSDNNAAVLLLHAFGMSWIEKDRRPETLKALGVAAPAEQRYLPAYDRDESYREALAGPWEASEHRGVLKWIRKYDSSLGAIYGASRRSRYYLPLVRAKDDELLVAGVPPVERVRFGGEALVIRANLALAEGSAASAWGNIRAAHQLAVLLGQDPTLAGQLVGVGLSETASRATVTLATSGDLPAMQARRFLADLQGLGPVPSAATAIDRAERYAALDAIAAMSKAPAGTLNEYLKSLPARGVAGAGPKAVPRALDAFAARADWNDVLRRANVYYDTCVSAMIQGTYAQRGAAYERIRGGLARLRKSAEEIDLSKPPVDAAGATRDTGSFVLSLMLADVCGARESADAGRAHRDVAAVALALAAYRGESGSYPDALTALTPGYLKTVPIDFCSGKPFVYKRAGKGYLLYSVGRNARDDGGAFDPDRHKDDLAARAEK